MVVRGAIDGSAVQVRHRLCFASPDSKFIFLTPQTQESDNLEGEREAEGFVHFQQDENREFAEHPGSNPQPLVNDRRAVQCQRCAGGICRNPLHNVLTGHRPTEADIAMAGRGRPGQSGQLKGVSWDFDETLKLESKPSELFPVGSTIYPASND